MLVRSLPMKSRNKVAQRPKLAQKHSKCVNMSISRLHKIVLSIFMQQKYFFCFEFDVGSRSTSEEQA